MNDKTTYYRREWLNRPRHGNGFIEAEVGRNGTLIIKDCTRQIELSFTTYDPVERENSLAKIALLIEVLEQFQGALLMAVRRREQEPPKPLTQRPPIADVISTSLGNGAFSTTYTTSGVPASPSHIRIGGVEIHPDAEMETLGDCLDQVDHTIRRLYFDERTGQVNAAPTVVDRDPGDENDFPEGF